MSNFGLQLFNAALTVLGGVFVYVVGQWILKIWIEPTQELRKLVGQIAFSLDFYANKIFKISAISPTEQDARDIWRTQACKLRELGRLIPCYNALYCWNGLPPKEDLYQASQLLISLANTPRERDGFSFPNQTRSEIKQLLGIKEV